MIKPFSLIVVTIAVVGSLVNDYDPASALAQPKNDTVKVVSEAKPNAEKVRKVPSNKSSRSRNTVTIRLKLGAPTNNKLFAKYFIWEKYGWKKKQYKCLVKLWERESGWSHLSKNKSSGAYGIPQSLPADKMSSVAKDWKTNPATQIKWGAKYIKHRYSTPCGALQHSYNHGWY